MRHDLAVAVRGRAARARCRAAASHYGAKNLEENTSVCRVAVGLVERAGEPDPQCDAGGRDYRLGDPHRAPARPSHSDTFAHQHVLGVRDWRPARRERPHALGVAVDSLSSHAPSELRDAVRVAAARSAGGGDGANVLISSSCPDLVRVGQLWKVAARHGIPLVALCENAQRRIDAQLTHAAATRAALQGPKATAMVLSILPVVGIGMGGLLGADPLHYLLGGGTGGVLLVAGTGLTTAGFVWSQRIMGKATS